MIISAVVNGGDASTAFLLSPGRRCRRLYSAASHSSSSSPCSIGRPRPSSPSSLLPPRPTCRRRRRCRRRWRRCFDLVVVVAPPLSFPPPPLFLWLTLLATSPSRPAIQRQPFRRCHHFRRGERRRDIHRAVVSIVVVGASRRSCRCFWSPPPSQICCRHWHYSPARISHPSGRPQRGLPPQGDGAAPSFPLPSSSLRPDRRSGMTMWLTDAPPLPPPRPAAPPSARRARAAPTLAPSVRAFVE